MIDSNIFQPGSTWELQATKQPTGGDVRGQRQRPIQDVHGLVVATEVVHGVGDAVQPVVQPDVGLCRPPARLNQPVHVHRVRPHSGGGQSVEHPSRPVGEVEPAVAEPVHVPGEEPVGPFGRRAGHDGLSHRLSDRRPVQYV